MSNLPSDVLKKIFNYYNLCYPLHKYIISSVCQQYNSVIRELRRQNPLYDYRFESIHTIKYATRNKFYGILNWLVDVYGIDVLKNQEVFIEACCVGDLATVSWLPIHDPNESFQRTAWITACIHGHIRVVKWLQVNFCNRPCYYIDRSEIKCLMINGNLKMLKWLIKHESSPNIKKYISDDQTWFVDTAVYNTEIFTWCITQNMRPSHKACIEAAKAGNLTVFKWLYHNNGLRDDLVASRMAAESGQIEILKFMHDNECRLSINIFSAAIIFGHLRVFEWSHQFGIKPSSIDFNNFSIEWKSEILLWIADNGFKIEHDLVYSVLLQGHHKFLKYLTKKGLIVLEELKITAEIVDCIIRRHHYDTLLYLIKNNLVRQNKFAYEYQSSFKTVKSVDPYKMTHEKWCKLSKYFLLPWQNRSDLKPINEAAYDTESDDTDMADLDLLSL